VFKKTFLSLLVLFATAALAVFLYRYQILQYSMEKIVRQYLPDYISVDKMAFNFKDSRISFRSFRIHNPPGFSGGNASTMISSTQSVWLHERQ